MRQMVKLLWFKFNLDVFGIMNAPGAVSVYKNVHIYVNKRVICTVQDIYGFYFNFIKNIVI